MALELSERAVAMMDGIPAEQEIRHTLAIVTNQAALLRQLLKIAQSKARSLDRLRGQQAGTKAG